MSNRESGFSVLELLAVLAVMGIIAAFALPSAFVALRNYRLHSDASTIASYANVTRMRAAARFAPYRINVDVPSGSYVMERLCGNTPSSLDSACTSAYAAFTSRQFEQGPQFITRGNQYSSCRPSGITAFPGTITSDPPSCPSLAQIHFNTRGLPVDNVGQPLTNGGGVIYLLSESGLVDAVTVTIGGRVTVWNWDPGASRWMMR